MTDRLQRWHRALADSAVIVVAFKWFDAFDDIDTVVFTTPAARRVAIVFDANAECYRVVIDGVVDHAIDKHLESARRFGLAVTPRGVLQVIANRLEILTSSSKIATVAAP